MTPRYCACCSHPSVILRRKSKTPMAMTLLGDGRSMACPSCDGGAVNTAIRTIWSRKETDNG